LADKLTQDQTGKIDAAVAALKDASASNDMAQVKAKSEELQKVLQEVGTVIYQQAAAEYAKQKGQPSQDASAAPSDTDKEKVVDSDDYKVK
jgi:molecular chaperone DnaK